MNLLANIDTRIELVEEQLQSLTNSGFFTEKEINQKENYLRQKLNLLKNLKKLQPILKNDLITSEHRVKLSQSWLI
nr:hypothetical protein [uncultured Flavobacterium sp.]